MKRLKAVWCMGVLVSCLGSAQFSAANDSITRTNFEKLATFGKVAEAKQLLLQNPQLRSMPDGTGEIRLIESAMFTAASTKGASFEFVKLMVDNGADVNAVLELTVNSRSSALTKAISSIGLYDDPKIWGGLVRLGVVTEHTTSRQDRMAIVKYLLEEGADPNESSVLQLSLNKGEDISKMILEAGADLKIVNADGKTLIETYEESIANAKSQLDLIRSIKEGK